MNKGRFESFSDSVFAFAITLLVLGFTLPVFRTSPTDEQLRGAIVDLWPNLIAYALSFTVIGIMWQNHHALFRLVPRIDRKTVVLNLFLLAGTVFVPFATTVLGTYPTMHTSAFLYGAVLSYTGTVYNILMNYVIATKAVLPSVSQAVLMDSRRVFLIGLLTYYVAMLLALWWPLLSFAAYVTIALYGLIPHGVDEDLAEL
jgi:uncharacterized membrane protein